jgi:hypothetical protein
LPHVHCVDVQNNAFMHELPPAALRAEGASQVVALVRVLSARPMSGHPAADLSMGSAELRYQTAASIASMTSPPRRSAQPDAGRSGSAVRSKPRAAAGVGPGGYSGASYTQRESRRLSLDLSMLSRTSDDLNKTGLPTDRRDTMSMLPVSPPPAVGAGTGRVRPGMRREAAPTAVSARSSAGSVRDRAPRTADDGRGSTAPDSARDPRGAFVSMLSNQPVNVSLPGGDSRERFAPSRSVDLSLADATSLDALIRARSNPTARIHAVARVAAAAEARLNLAHIGDTTPGPGMSDVVYAAQPAAVAHPLSPVSVLERSERFEVPEAAASPPRPISAVLGSPTKQPASNPKPSAVRRVCLTRFCRLTPCLWCRPLRPW